MEKFEFEVLQIDAGTRIDKFLADRFSTIKSEITRSKIQKFIEEDCVFDEKNQAFNTPSQKIKEGQKIIVNLPAPKSQKLEAKEIAFKIVYEDDDLLVIDKPAGLTVHPGTGNQDNTLVNALLFTHKNKLSSISGEFRPGIVHRLDKDTSGLMLVAKNDFAHQFLSKILQERRIKRSYLAFIYGAPSPKKGIIDKNIIRSKVNRLKMTTTRINPVSITSKSRKAFTHYETKQTFLDGFISLVECNLETGRTHQIRLHMESIKHSLVGDQLYNSCKKTAPKELKSDAKNFIANFPRQALHSYKIAFEHPRTQKEMSFQIELPDDLKKLEKVLIEN